MPAVRRTSPEPAQPLVSLDGGTSPEIEAVLDAALEHFADVGIRRSTIADLARRAGIDRVTVYRRMGSKDQLVQAVVAREAGRMFNQVITAAGAGATLEDRLAAGFATMILLTRGNALLNRLIALEPDTVLPRLTTEAAPLLAAAIATVMQIFDQAAQDGLTDGVEDAVASAEILVRVVHSYMLTPQGVLSLDSRDDLVAFAKRHLVPVVLSTAT